MMQKAKKIGMTDTTIVNSVGLNNGDMKSFKLADLPTTAENTMSARDVAILSQYLVKKHPELLQITAQKEVKFQITKDQVKTEQSLNKMLPGSKYEVKGVKIDGLKTGTSDGAGLALLVQGNIVDIG